jgi:surface protein
VALRRGTAGALGCVRCCVDGVGSARQAFNGASAFNQNIGSWNTAAVKDMAQASTLVPSHACGMPPKSFSQQWSRRQVVPGADVGIAHLGCGRVPAQMWVGLGSTVNEPCVFYLCMAACCNDVVRCSTAWYIVVCCSAMYGAAAWSGVAWHGRWARRCALLCGDGVGSARQAFLGASAFNQNIGSWNTAAVTTMAIVSALVLSHACGAQPTSLLAASVPAASSPQRSRGDGPLRMWASPCADVGESWNRCGRGLAQL